MRPRRAFEVETPHGVVIGVASHEGEFEHLPHSERALGRSLAGPARAGFVAGRLALREALHDLGAVSDIGRDDRGAPALTAGFSGTISHKVIEARAIGVAFARRDDGARVGVDLEIPRPRSFDIARRVLTDAELGTIAHLDGDARARFVIERFSMKEAVYKAIDPFLRRYVGFREVELVGSIAEGALRCVFVAPRVDEPDLEVEATFARVSVEGVDALVSTAIARVRRRAPPTQ